MDNQQRLIVGLAVIGIGVAFLLAALLRINLWAICLPVGLIALGGWLLLRPTLAGPDTAVRVKLLGDFRRSGAWEVADEEIWLGVGDVRLDLTEAVLPAGETKIKVYGFVSDVRLVVPDPVGVSISSFAFVSESRVYGEKEESFFVPIRAETTDYARAEYRVKIEMVCFVAEVRVKQG